MPKYGTKMTIQTNAGGEIKPATISINVEANSSEEAVVRLRSACARIMNSTRPRHTNERLLHLVDDKPIGGTAIFDLGDQVPPLTHWVTLTEPRNNDLTTLPMQTGNPETE